MTVRYLGQMGLHTIIDVTNSNLVTTPASVQERVRTTSVAIISIFSMNSSFHQVQPPSGTQNRTPHVPQEIVDHLIGFLHSDPHSLKSCSLVCQSWLHSSRPQLFRRLSLDSNTYRRFFNLFQNTQLHPCTIYCRSLELTRADWLFNMHGEGFREVTLHFSDTLINLDISQTTAPSFHHLLQAILPLRKLRHLTLDHFHFVKQPSSRPQPYTPTSPLIDTVSLRNTDTSHFFTSTIAFNAFDHLTTLHVDIMKEVDFPALGKYLLPRISQIENLTFRYWCKYDSNSFQICSPDDDARSPIQALYRQHYGLSISPTLKQLSRLRQIRIENYLDSSQDRQSTALFWAPRVLASLSSHFLRRVILTLHLDRAGQLDQYGVHWLFLDEILNSETYTRLEDITFESYGPADLSSLCDLLAARLPRAAKRRLLKVRSHKS